MQPANSAYQCGARRFAVRVAKGGLEMSIGVIVVVDATMRAGESKELADRADH